MAPVIKTAGATVLFAAEPAAASAAGAKAVAIVGTKNDILSAFADRKDITLVLSQVDAKSSSGSVREFFVGDVRNVVCVVPGKASRHNSAVRGDTVSKMLKSLNQIHSDNAGEIHVDVRAVLTTGVDADDAAVAMGTAVARAFPKYTRKTGEHRDVVVTVSFLSAQGVAYTNQVALTQVASIAENTRHAAALVDMPPNELNCTTYTAYVQHAVKDLKSPDVTVEVIAGEELKARGFGGIYSVGMAAEEPPALVILRYRPAGATKHVALCGKGIVYDTGGLSIKTKTGMPGMKHDMGGSAAIFHAFLAAVETGHKDNITALLCLAENAVDERAMRPDDVITLYSGKTCEVNNTDAEGRLVLADGVSYASRMDDTPDVICDMATLTGASGITSGRLHACVMSDSEDLETRCVRAGKRSGDLCHPMLFCPEVLNHEFSSAVADFKNSVKDRSNAQASCAGNFIGRNIHADYEGDWLHVDMAYPSFTAYDERATGYGVALLMRLFFLH